MSPAEPAADRLRILLVSQMYPGPRDPDLGVFVAQVEAELQRRGHLIDRVAVTRRGGPSTKHAVFALRVLAAALRRRPDVVYAHFLVPAGALAAGASVLRRAPLVVTAHGQDVRNAASIGAVRALTRLVVARATAVVAVSRALRDDLAAAVPAAGNRAFVIDSGVDVETFAGGDAAAARARLGLAGAEPPVFLFAGSLVERKNVVRLRDAFESLGRGTLVCVGDGPLRPELEGRRGIVLAGRVPHGAMADWMTACDVLCLPSLDEPFGQVLLEAMASGRSVVATRVGGPPEFVPPEAGALVDPLDVASIAAGMVRAAALPSPNPAARAAAAPHDVRRQAARVEALLLRAAGGAPVTPA